MNPAYELARADVGTWEWAEGHNPKVLQYFADVGHSWVQDDETAWCAAFVGAMLKRAGMAHTGKLNARSYLEWGDPVEPDDACPGDLAIYWRGSPDDWRGHVGFVAGITDSGDFMILGGNQGNQVSIRPYSRAQLLGVRRAPQVTNPTPVRVSPVHKPPMTARARQNAGGITAGIGAAAGAVGSVATASAGAPVPIQYALAAVIVMAVAFLLWRAWRADA